MNQQQQNHRIRTDDKRRNLVLNGLAKLLDYVNSFIDNIRKTFNYINGNSLIRSARESIIKNCLTNTQKTLAGCILS